MKQNFENISKKISRAIRHWWLMLIVGILSLVAGIMVFVFPLESYVTLSVLFGILMVLVGASQLIIASASNNYLMMRGYVIVGGVLDVPAVGVEVVLLAVRRPVADAAVSQLGRFDGHLVHFLGGRRVVINAAQAAQHQRRSRTD